MGKLGGFLVLACSLLFLAACGGGGTSSDSSGSGDWFYHWSCNGDSECLATNPTGAASGTLDEGPVESNCTSLLQFAQNFWGSAAQDSCDQSANGSSGGSTPTISSFSPASTAPGNSITITGSNFPSTASGVTVTIDNLTCTITSVSSTQIVCTLPAMGNFTGTFTVTTSGGSATSSGSLKVVNHLYGVAASTSEFVAVGGNGTILTSPDGSTWTAQTSGTTAGLNAVAWSSTQGAFVVAGQNGTVLRSTNGISWVSESVLGNSTNFYAVNWNGSQFVIIGGSTEEFTSPDGTTWTGHSTIPLSANYSGLAWSGSAYVAVGGSSGGSPEILTSTAGTTWTTQNNTAANGNQLLAAAFGNSEFVAVGDAQTVITSPTGSSWTKQTESEAGNLQGIVWSGTQFVVVGYDNSVFTSVILTSPDGVTWTSQNSVPGNNRSLNAVTFGMSEYVAVGGFGTIITSLNGTSWTNHGGI